VPEEPESQQPDLGPGDDADSESLASVILIDRREDIAAVCGRVDSAPTFAVVIHAPNGNRPLSTELGMRRLRRHAEDSGRVIAVATGNAALASRARQVGIPVARRPNQVRWDAGGRQVMRLGSKSFLVPPVARPLQLAVIAGVALALVVLALVLAPSAKVIAYPNTETIERTVTITASATRSDLDLAGLQVPARPASTTETVTLATRTTGKVQVASAPARLVATLTNTTGADVVIPGGSVLVAGTETFALDGEAKIAPGRGVQVQATAIRPGPGGNVAAGVVTGWLDTRFRLVTVTNAAAAAGGANTETPAVAAQDLVAIRNLANDLGKAQATKGRLLAARPHDAIFLGTADTSIEAGEPSAAAGEPAEVLFLQVKVTVTALAILEGTLDEVAHAVLLKGQPAGTLIPGTVTARETGARQANAEDGSIRTEILVRGQFARDVTEERLRSTVAGKSESAAKAALKERHGIADAEVKVAPGWAPRAPRFGFRITVELRHRPAENVANGASQDGRITPEPTATPRP
jgi:hypothetical protein